MEIKLSSCNVLYEDWQMQCCGEKIKVNQEVELIMQQHNPRILGNGIKVDFDENHHDICIYCLKGKVLSIKAIFVDSVAQSGYSVDASNIFHSVEIDFFDGWENFSEYHNFNKRPIYYLLEIKDATIFFDDSLYNNNFHKPKKNFEIKIRKFSSGWLDFDMIFDGIKIPFKASYVGKEPLGDLIYTLDILETPFSEDNVTHAYSTWSDEPGWVSFEFIRYLDNDLLDIIISFDEEYYLGENKRWEIRGIPYSFFKEEVLSCVAKMLKKYGIVGFCETWDQDQYNFPITTLIKILARNSKINDGKVFNTNICQDLNIISQFLL